jgi:hypothetical protein
MVSIMPPRLEVGNNFKLKVFFGGQTLKETFALDEFFSSDVREFSHMGEQKSTKP